MNRLLLTWAPIEPPREPAAVLATRSAARKLAAALLRRTGQSLLRAAFSSDAFLVLGGAEHLPWVDGAIYLGREDGLLLPTTETPSVPVDLLRSAIAVELPGLEYAVLPGRIYAFPSQAEAPDPDWLQQYVTGAAS